MVDGDAALDFDFAADSVVTEDNQGPVVVDGFSVVRLVQSQPQAGAASAESGDNDADYLAAVIFLSGYFA